LGVLCDKDIRKAIKEKRLIIDPEPKLEYYDPTAVDLTLDDQFLQWDLEALKRAWGEIPPLDIHKSDSSVFRIINFDNPSIEINLIPLEI